MTKRGSMELLTLTRASSRVNMIHFRALNAEAKANNKGSMDRASGNNNSNRTNSTKIKQAMNITRKITDNNQNMSNKQERIIKGELKKPLITSSKTQIKTQGIIKIIMKKC